MRRFGSSLWRRGIELAVGQVNLHARFLSIRVSFNLVCKENKIAMTKFKSALTMYLVINRRWNANISFRMPRAHRADTRTAARGCGSALTMI